MTVFTGLMLAFPTYAHVFFPKTENKTIITNRLKIQTAEFKINGMTCSACEEHLNQEVNKLDGIVISTASYENENAIVEFDSSKTNIAEIEKAINETAYLVTDKKEN